MKRILIVSFAAALILAGCKQEYITYSGGEYIMFADTMAVYRVQNIEGDSFSVPIASTAACDYDRTIAVEIIDAGSNAIEGRHYKLKSNTVTIKAGQTTTNVEVLGNYDRLESEDSLGFRMRLIMPEQLEWVGGDSGIETKVTMYKYCPFVQDNYSGYCWVTSRFEYALYTNGYVRNKLIFTEKHPTEPNTIICRNWLYDGYDIKIRLKPEDISKSEVVIEEGEVMYNELMIFGQIHGDNKIYVRTIPDSPSTYSTCDPVVNIIGRSYLENLGTYLGILVDFKVTMEWISDAEAYDLMREGY